jgi:prolyl oligopeptidase
MPGQKVKGKHAKVRGLRPPPTAPRRGVVDIYHKVAVSDDYRWLENGKSRSVRQWTAAHSRRARAFLDSLPQRNVFARRLEQIMKRGYTYYLGFRSAGDRLFALKYDSRRNRPRLVVWDSDRELDRERVLLDTAKLARPGATVNFDLFVPSSDGRLLAACLSEGGSEEGDLHVFDAVSGKRLRDVIHRAQRIGGSSVAWAPNGRGFYYVRHPLPGERAPEDLDFYQQVYFHQLGTPETDDTYAVGKEFPRIAELKLASCPDPERYLVRVAHGDGGQFEHWISDGKTPWVRVTDPADEVVRAELGRDGHLYLVSRKGSPRGRILRVKGPDWKLSEAEIVVPEREWILEELAATPDHLYLKEQLGGLGRLDRLDLRTGTLEEIPLPPNSGVREVTPLSDGRVLFGVNTFLSPSEYFVVDRQVAPVSTALSSAPPVDASRWEVLREYATSKDGTRVPISIIAPKGFVRDGTKPFLLTGYGGYGISMSPNYVVWLIPWLEKGGLLGIANLRGGGEFGEDWHRAGMLTKKQNVFDDFIACGEHLCGQQYTSHDRLGIFGGSNGGLLMGAVLTQRPDLARAVVASVGIFDSLVSERDSNGQFNVTEFGTVKDPEQFRALYAYSPYHHVVDGTPYPAILLSTGENDRRVNPLHSRKMAARLQAATVSDEPILLRTSGKWGHGPTSFGDAIGLMADHLAFFADRLALPRTGPTPGKGP